MAAKNDPNAAPRPQGSEATSNPVALAAWEDHGVVVMNADGTCYRLFEHHGVYQWADLPAVPGSSAAER